MSFIPTESRFAFRSPEIENLVSSKLIAGTKYYLVKWKDWPEVCNSWIAEKNVPLKHLPEISFRTPSTLEKSPRRQSVTSWSPFGDLSNFTVAFRPKTKILKNAPNSPIQPRINKRRVRCTKRAIRKLKVVSFRPLTRLFAKQRRDLDSWYNYKGARTRSQVRLIRGSAGQAGGPVALQTAGFKLKSAKMKRAKKIKKSFRKHQTEQPRARTRAVVGVLTRNSSKKSPKSPNSFLTPKQKNLKNSGFKAPRALKINTRGASTNQISNFNDELGLRESSFPKKPNLKKNSKKHLNIQNSVNLSNNNKRRSRGARNSGFGLKNGFFGENGKNEKSAKIEKKRKPQSAGAIPGVPPGSLRAFRPNSTAFSMKNRLRSTNKNSRYSGRSRASEQVGLSHSGRTRRMLRSAKLHRSRSRAEDSRNSEKNLKVSEELDDSRALRRRSRRIRKPKNSKNGSILQKKAILGSITSSQNLSNLCMVSSTKSRKKTRRSKAEANTRLKDKAKQPRRGQEAIEAKPIMEPISEIDTSIIDPKSEEGEPGSPNMKSWVLKSREKCKKMKIGLKLPITTFYSPLTKIRPKGDKLQLRSVKGSPKFLSFM